MTLHLVWAVLGMLVLTFGIRLSFLVFGHRLRFPDCLQRSLRYVPAAVLTALIVPMALAPHGAVDLSPGNAYLPGTLAADRSLPGMPDPKSMLGEGAREQQMSNLKSAVLQRVQAAVALVSAKGSPAEAEAYRQMLVDVAQQAADASKEGGFLGFGGVRVSDKEKAFIAEVKGAAGLA